MQQDLGVTHPDSGAVVGPPILSPEFLRRAERVPASLDPDTATAQTVAIMCQHIRRAASDPLVRACAFDAVRRFRGGFLYWKSGRDPFGDPGAIAESAWWWAKYCLRFVHHSKLIYVWLNERDQLQLLISPEVLVRMRHMVGDCAIYSMMVAAFLEVLGVPWEIVTLAVNRENPEVYSHVFVRAVLSDGRRMPLDASHGLYAGWQVPERDVLRRQVWDSAGRAIEDSSRGRFEGLHNYVPARRGSYPGLGDDDSTTSGSLFPYSDSGDTNPITGQPYGSVPIASPTSPFDSTTTGPLVSSDYPTVNSTSASQSYPAGSITVPPQSDSTAWAAFLTQMAKSGMQLAQLEAIPAGTIVNPSGQIIRQATGYPVTSGTTLTGSVNTSSVLLFGGLALVGVVVLMSMNRR